MSATRLGLALLGVALLGIAGPGAATEATAPEGGWQGNAAAPPTPAIADPIERAWRSPALSLEERVSRTRRASLEAGIWSLDTAARAVQHRSFPGPPLDRAEAAVALAPDLPAAHMARARALWLHGGSPIAAARAAVAALGAVPRHPEASLWFGGSALLALAIALMAAGLLCLAGAGALVVPHAIHDLGDAVSVRMPGFARGALLAALVLLPLVIGEGLLGLGAALLAIGATYGSARGRIVLGLGAAALLAGAYPVARLAGATLEAFADDPVAEAAVAVAGGLPLAQDLARLEAAAEDDLLAEWALAVQARREGRLGTADARYQALLEVLPEDAIVVNNAAGVRLGLGHMESAIELYRRAAELSGWPVVLFNLSQAYGRAFQMEELARTLGLAQELDAELVAELTALQGTDTEAFVVDLPLPVSLLWRRILESPGGAGIAAELRGPVAPGLLGRDGRAASLAFAAFLTAGSLIGSRVRASRWCGRCGRRVCPRCHPESAGRAICPPCVRLFHDSASADRALRQARIEALRKRELRWERLAWLASVAVPGLAGFLSRRPLRSLVGAFFFALAAVCVVFRNGAVPDPLVVGTAAPFAFLGTAVIAGVAYAASVASCLAARRRA